MPEVQVGLRRPRLPGVCGQGAVRQVQEAEAMILFYRERNGDYLAINTATNGYYRRTFGKDHFEGRATAIEGLVTSVCTTGISRGFLRQECRRVAKGRVPADWRKAIGL